MSPVDGVARMEVKKGREKEVELCVGTSRVSPKNRSRSAEKYNTGYVVYKCGISARCPTFLQLLIVYSPVLGMVLCNVE